MTKVQGRGERQASRQADENNPRQERLLRRFLPGSSPARRASPPQMPASESAYSQSQCQRSLDQKRHSEGGDHRAPDQ